MTIAIRYLLKKRNRALSHKIEEISLFKSGISYCNAKSRFVKLNECNFVDISADIERVFEGVYLTPSKINEVIQFYSGYFNEAYALVKSLKVFGIEPTENIGNFINDYGNIREIIDRHNEPIIQNALNENKIFFDTCLKYPLDNQQRRSIVSEADNCLVVSSAGSGKTSSIIGKVKYLIEVKGIDPQKILLISYTNKAASELTKRLDTPGLKGYTFHKLAIDMISKNNGVKPTICDNADILFIDIFRDLYAKEKFRDSILKYYVDYQSTEAGPEKEVSERRSSLSEQKKNRIMALLPDMDGKPIYVRSAQEQKICFALSSLGVDFRYEEPYEYPLADEMHSQYRPDFSIYFHKNGKQERIYLEHFGVDDHGFVPAWFAKDKQMSYDEANKKYNDGISWKKAAHEKFGTKLLTTASADFHHFDIREKIKELLVAEGVSVKEMSNSEMLEAISPKGSKKEKAFIRFVVTFITLLKSSRKSIWWTINEAERANDDRGVFIIKNIIMPIYNQYVELLKQKGLIDFTDAILLATDICKNNRIIEYDYIIVDEFQDISIDRYAFLKELRKGFEPAKLYCVGDDWQSIYRFSGSDMALFNQFSDFFGPTEVNKIETTYRFGEPLITKSSDFIQRNDSQIQKKVRPFSQDVKTELEFYSYDKNNYCSTIEQIISAIPTDKSIYLLGRYSFDDYYLSYKYPLVKEQEKFYYLINGRKIEFLTVHKSKGLEADYAILLQCNKDVYGFPSLMNDDPILNYVLTERDKFPFGEERRLFYVAITRAKIKTIVLYDRYQPSVFVDEFLNPEKLTENTYAVHPNANKRWTKNADAFLLQLHSEGKSIKYIAKKLGRSQTSIAMRLNKLDNA